MRIACVGYRDWALEIYDRLSKNKDHHFLIIRSKIKYDENAVYSFNPDIILYYGWSWFINKEIIKKYKCIMLHPSPLPKYRGGSPIQNQIINNEGMSAVTLFLMDEGMDTGPILSQKEFSLSGELSEIFQNISNIGYELTNKILNAEFNPVPQDNDNATVFKRRKPHESEITIDEIQNKPARYLYNKIRMLQFPYPNAFIKTCDGKKIFLTQSYLEEN